KILTRRAAREVLRPSAKRMKERTAGWLVLVGGVLTFIVVTAAAPDRPCTETAPCAPDVGGSLLIGMLAILPFLGWVHVWFAAAAATTMSVALISYDLVNADEAFPLWVPLVGVAYAGGCALLAGTVASRRRPAARRWHDLAEELPPPAPARFLRPPLPAAIASAALLAAGLAGAVWVAGRQAQADDRQRTAEIVAATVRSHPRWDALELALPADARTLTGTWSTEIVDVYDADAYPVGSTVRIAVDDNGLRQLLAEPYDATPWYALVSVLVLLGAGFGWRFAVRALAQRRLFRRPQPVTEVRIRRGHGRVYVYAGQASAPEALIGEIPVRDDIEPAPGAAAEPAVLYGVRAPGEWCTVTLGPVTLSPALALRHVTDRTALAVAEGTGSALHSPARSPGEGAGSREWPELRGWGIALSVTLILGATVAGIAMRERILAALLDVLCTDGGCSPAGMVAAGWATIGLPMLVAGGIYFLAGPSRPALWGLVTAVAALGGGLGVMFIGKGDSARQAAEFHAGHPDMALLFPGFAAALAALLIGAWLGQAIRTLHEKRQARPSRRALTDPDPDPDPDPASRHFLIVIACEVVALIGALAWVTFAA
ncbi:hypothetical protein ACL02O_33990, partial [Micromonospora sp. MS34]|uniref:hypothetical protein n=1 Tax=Micromonospora sp. MS34 TaxID=3385971 RepID=UPI0039A33E6D